MVSHLRMSLEHAVHHLSKSSLQLSLCLGPYWLYEAHFYLLTVTYYRLNVCESRDESYVRAPLQPSSTPINLSLSVNAFLYCVCASLVLLFSATHDV